MSARCLPIGDIVHQPHCQLGPKISPRSPASDLRWAYRPPDELHDGCTLAVRHLRSTERTQHRVRRNRRIQINISTSHRRREKFVTNP
jgi:hypothetical protein